MANVKITELTELVAPQKSDVILVVDTLNDQTKKASVENLLATGVDDGTY